MPFVRIDLLKGKNAEYRQKISEVIYDAMLKTINIPQGDRFHVITERDPENFFIDPNYLGIARSKDVIVIQITLNEGRSIAQKQGLYKAIADGLNAALGLRREDVFINLVDVKKENWSLGNGIAQYAA
jgi:phenylpyruvate tautomerase PptA (4-oxalocrotonate tautomerase family)